MQVPHNLDIDNSTVAIDGGAPLPLRIVLTMNFDYPGDALTALQLLLTTGVFLIEHEGKDAQVRLVEWKQIPAHKVALINRKTKLMVAQAQKEVA